MRTQKGMRLMGMDVYVESQLHAREHAGQEVADALESLIEVAPPGGCLGDVFEWGDTMFNIPQLRKLDAEIQNIAETDSRMSDSAELVRGVIEAAIRKRGYIWISGD